MLMNGHMVPCIIFMQSADTVKYFSCLVGLKKSRICRPTRFCGDIIIANPREEQKLP
jgi:hypothetical protein